MEPVRVILTADLSEFNTKLVPGLFGTTTGPCSHKAKLNKDYIGVKFDIGPHLDVKWDQIEIIPH